MPARGERGSGTLIAGVAAASITALVCLVVCAAVFARAQHRVDGAADLAAIAGGQAQLNGGAGCDAARASAAANGGRLDRCQVAGDEVELVVSVVVSAPVSLGGWSWRVSASAHAGVVTGAPE